MHALRQQYTKLLPAVPPRDACSLCKQPPSVPAGRAHLAHDRVGEDGLDLGVRHRLLAPRRQLLLARLPAADLRVQSNARHVNTMSHGSHVLIAPIPISLCACNARVSRQ